MIAVKTIAHLDRLTNSHSGNPRWLIAFSDGTVAETKPDAAANYDVSHDMIGALVKVTVEGQHIVRIERQP